MSFSIKIKRLIDCFLSLSETNVTLSISARLMQPAEAFYIYLIYTPHAAIFITLGSKSHPASKDAPGCSIRAVPGHR